MGVGIVLYLYGSDVKVFKWNGLPLPEATKAVVSEVLNGDYKLTVEYPITDTGIYRKFKQDMLISAPTPQHGKQFFRLKKPVEGNDNLILTCYHISEDAMMRSIRPMGVVRTHCQTALNSMISASKSSLADFSFFSDITSNHTYTIDETKTLYSVLLDGAHSIVGTWEGELIRNNLDFEIVKNRGKDRGVILSTHFNIDDYEREIDSYGVYTRIHANSTFRPEGAEEEMSISVTVDSPLINQYPYLNEVEYQNNDIQTEDELRKWAEAKFRNEGIDKPSDKLKISSRLLDGQIVHLGDTVAVKSHKHNADFKKKAVEYNWDALEKEYIDITFDDKVVPGGNGMGGGGISHVASTILGLNDYDSKIQELVDNANRHIDSKFEKRVEEINDGIELAKVKSEEYAENVRNDVESKIEEVTRQLTDEQAELEKRNQAELDAFRDELANFNFDEDRINELIKGIDVTQAFEDVKAEIDKTFADVKSQIMAVSETSRVNAEMIGYDGLTRYNKNLVMDGTSRKIQFEGRATVRANDGGFKRGQTYTISFEALCQMMAKVAVSLTQSHAKLIQATFTDPRGKFPTVNHEMSSSPSSVELYPYPYSVNIKGPWYKSKTLSVNPAEATSLDLALEYREIADGNLEAEIIGTWAEVPEIIFDGGG